MEITLADVIGWLVRWCGLATMFAMGLRADWAHTAYLLRRPALLIKSFLAVYLLTPLLAVLMFRYVEVDKPLELAVSLMALSAAAPALPTLMPRLLGNPRFIHGGGILTALMAVLAVPVSLVAMQLLLKQDIPLTPREAGRYISTTVLLPQLAGAFLRYLAPSFATRLSEPLMSLAGLMLVIMMALITILKSSAILGLGLPAMLMIVALAVASLAIGHTLGGPRAEDRTSLAFACATRFPALGVLLATMIFPDIDPLPAVVAYMFLTHLTAIPYLLLRKTNPPTPQSHQPPEPVVIDEPKDIPASLSLKHRSR